MGTPVSAQDETYDPERRLAELGIELPEPPSPVANYVNGSRLGLYDYDRRLLTATGFPPVVLPTHWDNFRLPDGFSQEANVQRNILPFIEAANIGEPNAVYLGRELGSPEPVLHERRVGPGGGIRCPSSLYG